MGGRSRSMLLGLALAGLVGCEDGSAPAPEGFVEPERDAWVDTRPPRDVGPDRGVRVVDAAPPPPPVRLDAGPIDPRVAARAWPPDNRPVGLAAVPAWPAPLGPRAAWQGGRLLYAWGHRLYVVDAGAQPSIVAHHDLPGPVDSLWQVDDAVVGVASVGAPLAVPEGGSFRATTVVFRVVGESIAQRALAGVAKKAALGGGQLLLALRRAPDGWIAGGHWLASDLLVALDASTLEITHRLPLPAKAEVEALGALSVLRSTVDGARSLVHFDATTGFDGPHAPPSDGLTRWIPFPGGVLQHDDAAVRPWTLGPDGWTAGAAIPCEAPPLVVGDRIFEPPRGRAPGAAGTLADPTRPAGWAPSRPPPAARTPRGHGPASSGASWSCSGGDARIAC